MPDMSIFGFSTVILLQGSAAFDDVCSELAMAILQFFQNKPPEEQVFRCMGALAKFCNINREVGTKMKITLFHSASQTKPCVKQGKFCCYGVLDCWLGPRIAT